MNSVWRITVLFALLLSSGGVFINTTVAESEEQVLTTAFCCGRPRGFSLFHFDSLRSIYSGVSGPLYTFYYPISELPEPIMAKEAPLVASDNKTYTVTLRDGVKFSNGHDLTAEDVVFTYNAYLTQTINENNDHFTDSEFEQWFDSNSSIIAIDDRTIQFEFSKPSFGNIEALTVPIVEKARYVDRYNDCLTALDIEGYPEENLTDFYDGYDPCNWTGAEPLDGSFVHSSGPYMLDKLNFDGSGNFTGVELVRNPYYFDQSSYADRIEVLFFPEEDKGGADMARDIFNQGKIDTFFSNFFWPIDPFDLQDNPNYEVVRDKTIHSFELMLNHLHPYFGTGEAIPNGGGAVSLTNEAQARFLRKAMLHAINRAEMIPLFQAESATNPIISKTSIQESGTVTNGSLAPYAFDLELAKSFMEQAGFNFSNIVDANNDGDYSDEGDTTFFNITMISPNDRTPGRLNSSLIIQESLPKIGIGVAHDLDHTFFEILFKTVWRRYFDTNGTLTPLYDDGGYDVMPLIYEEDPQFYKFDNRYTIDRRCDNQDFDCTNIINYVNPVVDALSNLHDATFDLATRKQLLLEMEAILYEELPSLPLVQPARFAMHKKEVKGFDTIMLNRKHIEWRVLHKEGWRRGPVDEEGQFTVSPILMGGAAVLVVAVVLAKRRGVF